MTERRAFRSTISYIDRSRDYYAAQGYGKPYTWAYHRSVPFATLPKGLSECRIGLVTTASNVETADGAEELLKKDRRAFAAPSRPVPDRLFTEHLFWDKATTHTDDLDSFLPINRLSEFASSGRIGSVSGRYYGAPTSYSLGRTKKQDAPNILQWAGEDGVDAMLLTAL